MSPVSLTVIYPADTTNAGTKNVSASWDGDANHTGNSNTGSYEIEKAPSLTTVTCTAGSVYTGSPIEPCTYTVTGVGGLNIGPSPVPAGNYTNNINAGVDTASAKLHLHG